MASGLKQSASRCTCARYSASCAAVCDLDWPAGRAPGTFGATVHKRSREDRPSETQRLLRSPEASVRARKAQAACDKPACRRTIAKRPSQAQGDGPWHKHPYTCRASVLTCC